MKIPQKLIPTLLGFPLLVLSGCQITEPVEVEEKRRIHREELGSRRDSRLGDGQIAPLLEGLGDHHHEATTRQERAQLFCDQGLRLAFAFNHKEALRAFKEAARLDPDCAMAYWGQALILGPNINLPMQANNDAPAYAAIQLAILGKSQGTPLEEAYIDALATRHAKNPGNRSRPWE